MKGGELYMLNFIKKLSGKKAESGCCGVEIKEVKEAENNDTCCSSSDATSK